MPSPKARNYRLEAPLQAMLEVSLDKLLPAAIEDWKAEVAAGEISEGAHQVFVALHWINARDIRVTPITSGAMPARKAKAEPAGQETLISGG